MQDAFKPPRLIRNFLKNISLGMLFFVNRCSILLSLVWMLAFRHCCRVCCDQRWAACCKLSSGLLATLQSSTSLVPSLCFYYSNSRWDFLHLTASKISQPPVFLLSPDQSFLLQLEIDSCFQRHGFKLKTGCMLGLCELSHTSWWGGGNFSLTAVHVSLNVI